MAPTTTNDAVDAARDKAPAPDEVERITTLLRLLSDPTRTRIVYALLAAGEMCVSDLAEVVGASESTVSHALRLLRTGRVVQNRRDGRTVHYRLHDAHVAALLDVLREHVTHETEDER